MTYFFRFINYSLHLGAIGAIYYFWQPISAWFLSKVPALGVDLYLSATYAAYHLRNFSLPFNSFKDIWFGGYPLISDYPQLAFILMTPFVGQFGPVVGVQKFTMFALLFLIIVCYFLFYKLSRNQGIAIFLAILVLLSPNIYGAATWAGSIPYFLSQAFFPLGLLAGAFYLENPKPGYVAMMALVTGLGFLINGFGIITFLIPSMFLVILLGGLINRVGIKKIISHFIFYNFSWLLTSFTVTFQQFLILLREFQLPSIASRTLDTVDTGSSSAAAARSSEIAQFYKNLINLLFERTDPLIFSVLGAGVVIFLISAVFLKNKKKLLLLLPIVLIVAWTFLHPVINFSGIYQILRHDPYRAFWQATIGAATLAAFLSGFLYRAVFERIEAKKYLLVFFFLVNIALSGALVLATYIIFGQKVNETIKVVESNAEYSSAFPESLSIRFTNDEIEKLKSELVPSFMDPNDQNTRLYSADATVNIWWNVFFKMPMVRGYVDPPIGTNNRGGFFWLDIAIANDSLTRDFKASEDVALKNALFLMDWYGIGFFEGGRLSSKGPSVGPSSYLLNNNAFSGDELVTTYGAVLKYLDTSGKSQLIPDLPQNLHYFKVADNVTSPILYPTDSSVVAVASSNAGYEDVTRIFGFFNLNSKKIIPVHIPIIDRLSLSDLKSFDAVFLHQYEYHNQKKTFSLLQKYVEDGGKVFIDTGSEVKESEGEDLPAIFPFNASVRRGFGKQWQLSSEGDLLKGIDLNKFGPLIFADNDWKLTVPENGDLKEGSKVILSHHGKPVLIERNLGKGKVIWSGMNLVYHFNQYKSDHEANLFMNILRDFTSVDEKEPLDAKTQWLAPEKVIIETDQRSRGILFKEQGYPGWKAKVIGGKSLPVYLTGPTYPGFMYVFLPSDVTGPVKVEFSYNGTVLFWFVALVNLIAILVMLDLGILSGKMSRVAILRVSQVLGKRISSWWRKEDE